MVKEMTMTTGQTVRGPEHQQKGWADTSLADILARITLRTIVSLVVPIITFIVLWRAFIFMRDAEASKFAIAVVALIVGVGGVWVLYIASNALVEMLPIRLRDTLRPFLFVGPAMVIIAIFLIYPIFNTGYLSIMDARSQNYVGLQNYIRIFTERDFLLVLRNNVLWIVLVTGFTVSLGLVIAMLVDRIGRWEPVAKSLIFLPMAISAVGASVIWGFIYATRPEGAAQIGLLNALIVALGGQPISILTNTSLNNFALIIVMIWILTGYCMVILSAAIKGVPAELVEAGRIDGAGEVRIFFSIIIPTIRGTIVTVATTVFIMVLKVFDIVYVMTSGQRDTEVIANRMYKEFFINGNYGVGSALAVILLIAVMPVIYSNVRELRRRKEW
jgi:alpha-glucoside transport system permease protein